jgi:copper(I)-binding protein
MILALGTALFTLLTASVTSVPAPGLAVSEITADHGTVWQTKKVGDLTQGFLQIRNDAATPDTLTAWACPLADTTELAGADGKTLRNLQIPANQTVTLAADGPHLVLHSTHFTVDRGSAVPCTLTFQNEGVIAVLLYAEPAPKS